MAAYRTIASPATAEIVEKKSRFIGQIAPAQAEEEALAFLEAVRAEHRMARHNVYAYVLRSGRVRYSGMPTLEAVQHADLVDVAVVVTRYFGGTLLGTGGLVRAYAAATRAAIEAARIVVVSRCVDVVAEVPYALYEQAVRVAEGAGAHVEGADFGAEVLLTLRLLDGAQEPLVAKLTELTRGQAEVLVSAPFDAAF